MGAEARGGAATAEHRRQRKGVPCYSKNPKNGVTYTTGIYFSHLWGLGRPQSGRWQVQCLRTGFLAIVHVLLCPQGMSSTPKAPSPNTITWGLGFHIWILGRQKHSVCSTV